MSYDEIWRCVEMEYGVYYGVDNDDDMQYISSIFAQIAVIYD